MQAIFYFHKIIVTNMMNEISQPFEYKIGKWRWVLSRRHLRIALAH